MHASGGHCKLGPRSVRLFFGFSFFGWHGLQTGQCVCGTHDAFRYDVLPFFPPESLEVETATCNEV